MWIKSEDGTLYKVDEISSVRAAKVQTGRGQETFVVSAVVAGEKVQLTMPGKTEEEVRELLDRIYRLGRNDHLDLSHHHRNTNVF